MGSDVRDMVAVPIDIFVKGLPINVDAFVALSESKHVLVFKAGTPVDLERVQGYRERELKELHLRRSDCRVFLQSQMTMAFSALNHPKLASEHRLRFLQVAHQLLSTSLSTMGFSAETYEAARVLARSLIGLVAAEPQLFALLERFQKNSEAAINHGMGVGLISAMLGRAMGWTRPETIERLVLGGILHDVGLNEAGLENHTVRGVEILQTVSAVHSDVLAIVSQHHETANGEGFPKGLRDLKMNPLAKVVAVADVFCDLTLVTETNAQPLSPVEAIAHIEAAMGQPFNKDVFRKLKLLVVGHP